MKFRFGYFQFIFSGGFFLRSSVMLLPAAPVLVAAAQLLLLGIVSAAPGKEQSSDVEVSHGPILCGRRPPPPTQNDTMEGNTGICSLLGRGKIRFWEWRYGSCKILTLKIQKKVTWPGKISTTTSSFFSIFLYSFSRFLLHSTVYCTGNSFI
jgi:hypothetical protein